MEVGCKVDAQPIGGGERRHILSAYFTFVAMGSDGKPQAVPALAPESELEHRRYEEAALRRKTRLEHAEAVRQLRGRAGC